MKKCISAFFIIMICIIFSSNSSAYSNDKYSINIPAGYSEVKENTFKDENGNTIQVQTKSFSDDISGEEVYTQSNLETWANSLKEGVSKYKNNLKELLIAENNLKGNTLTQEEIDKYVESFETDIIKKEITTFTKNKYKCFHVIIKLSTGDFLFYMDNYTVTSGKELYSLSISANDINSFNSDLITDTIDSFTINNLKSYQETSFIADLIPNLLFTVIAFELVPFLLKVIRKKTFSKKNAAIISITNSIVVQIIIVSIEVYLMYIYDDVTGFNFAPAFVYGVINYCWLQSKVKNKNNNDKNKELANKNELNKIKNIDKEIRNESNIISTEEKIQSEMTDKNNIIYKAKKRYCSSCGKKVKENWDFCNYCGNKLK